MPKNYCVVYSLVFSSNLKSLIHEPSRLEFMMSPGAKILKLQIFVAVMDLISSLTSPSLWKLEVRDLMFS